MRFGLTMVLFVGCSLLSACSKKTEVEQLAGKRNSFAYSNYHRLSSHGLTLGIKAYQKSVLVSGARELPEFTSSDICFTRALLAYGALTTDKNIIALVEADLIDEEKCEPILRGVASSIRGVIYSRENWPNLAIQETENSEQIFAGFSDKEHSESKLISLHVALATNAVLDKDYATAQTHADALGLILKLPWLSELSHCALLFQRGNLTDGMRETKKLSQNPSAPPILREKLSAFISAVEHKTGNVDAPAFMLRLVSITLLDMVAERSSGAIARASEFVRFQSKNPDH